MKIKLYTVFDADKYEDANGSMCEWSDVEAEINRIKAERDELLAKLRYAEARIRYGSGDTNPNDPLPEELATTIEHIEVEIEKERKSPQ